MGADAVELNADIQVGLKVLDTMFERDGGWMELH